MKILHALILLGQILYTAASSSTTIVVSVVAVNGVNRYAFDGTVYDEYAISYGHNYIFDISGLSGHPFSISKRQGGNHYGYPLMDLTRTSTELTLSDSDIRSSTFYFLCTTHQGMGGMLKATSCSDSTSDVSAHATCCAQSNGCYDPSCSVHDSQCKPNCHTMDGQTQCDAQSYCTYDSDPNVDSCRNPSSYYCAENSYGIEGECVACDAGYTRPAGDDPRSGNIVNTCTPPPSCGDVFGAGGATDVATYATCCLGNGGCSDNSCVDDGGTCKLKCEYLDGQTQCDGQSHCSYDSNDESCLYNNAPCGNNQHVQSNQCVNCATAYTRPAGDDPTGADTQCQNVFVDYGLAPQADITGDYTCFDWVYPTTIESCKEKAATDGCVGFAWSAQYVACAGYESITSVDFDIGGNYRVYATTVPTGAYCAKNYHVQSSACVPCPTGHNNDEGDDPTGADTSCIDPTAPCLIDHRVESNACVACASGLSRPAGDDPSGADTACARVFFDHGPVNDADTYGTITSLGWTSWNVDCEALCVNNCIGYMEHIVNPTMRRCLLISAIAQVEFAEPTAGFRLYTTSSTPPPGPQYCKLNYHVQSGLCVACPSGDINTVGDDRFGGDTACDVVSSVPCAENEHVSPGYTQCTACAAGRTNAAGDIPTNGATACDCGENEHVHSNQCVACGAGLTRQAGDDPAGANTVCTKVFYDHGPINDIDTYGTITSLGYTAWNVDCEALCGSNCVGFLEHVHSPTMRRCLLISAITQAEFAEPTAGFRLYTTSPTPPPGPQYCKQNYHVQSGLCVACPGGSTNDAGDDRTQGDTSCDAGACATNEHVQAGVCTPCAAGVTRLAGDDPAGGDTQCGVAYKHYAPAGFISGTALNTGDTVNSPEEAMALCTNTANCVSFRYKLADKTVHMYDKDALVASDMQYYGLYNAYVRCDTFGFNILNSNTQEDKALCPNVCDPDHHVQGNQCVACPAGQTRPYGDDPTGADTQCSAPGCAENFHVLAQDCVACPAGQTRPAGDDPTAGDTQCSFPANYVGYKKYAPAGFISGTALNTGDTVNSPEEAMALCTNTANCVSFRYKLADKTVHMYDKDALVASDMQYYGLYNAYVRCDTFGFNILNSNTQEDKALCPNVCDPDHHVQGNQCVACPAGQTRPYGDDPTGADTQCSAPGCAENFHVLAQDCVACPAGQTRPAGDDPTAGDTQCNAPAVDCVETYGTCKRDCMRKATVTVAQSGSGAACVGDTECSDGLCTRLAISVAAIATKSKSELVTLFDAKTKEDDSAHPMKALISATADVAQVRKLATRFQKVKTRVAVSSGELVMSEEAKTKAVQGDLRSVLDAQSGDDVKAVRKAILKSLEVTEPLVVQLEGTKKAVLKPALAFDAPSTLNCATATSTDTVGDSGQVAYLQANQKIEFCYAGTKYKAQADAQGDISVSTISRRLSRKLLADCSSANYTTNGDEVVIQAPDGCVYEDQSFRQSAPGHYAESGVESPCATGTYQDEQGTGSCKGCPTGEFNLGTGNIGCGDCTGYEGKLRACGCCTGCQNCAAFHHGAGDHATLANDVMIQCSDAC